MTPSTLSALHASIAHWTENEQALRPDDTAIGSGACALCKLFLHDDCVGCPVHAVSGEVSCRGTPYTQVLHERASWSFATSYPELQLSHPWIALWSSREAFLLAAKAERQFLESLL